MPGVGTTFDGETQEMAIKSANLPAPKEKEFSDNRPRTRDSWKLFEQLLDREGSLTNEASLEIEHGLKSIRVQEKVLEIEARLRSGGDLPDPTHPNASTRIAAADALGGGASAIVRWSAVKELG